MHELNNWIGGAARLLTGKHAVRYVNKFITADTLLKLQGMNAKQAWVVLLSMTYLNEYIVGRRKPKLKLHLDHFIELVKGRHFDNVKDAYKFCNLPVNSGLVTPLLTVKDYSAIPLLERHNTIKQADFLSIVKRRDAYLSRDIRDHLDALWQLLAVTYNEIPIVKLLWLLVWPLILEESQMSELYPDRYRGLLGISDNAVKIYYTTGLIDLAIEGYSTVASWINNIPQIELPVPNFTHELRWLRDHHKENASIISNSPIVDAILTVGICRQTNWLFATEFTKWYEDIEVCPLNPLQVPGWLMGKFKELIFGRKRRLLETVSTTAEMLANQFVGRFEF